MDITEMHHLFQPSLVKEFFCDAEVVGLDGAVLPAEDGPDALGRG